MILASPVPDSVIVQQSSLFCIELSGYFPLSTLIAVVNILQQRAVDVVNTRELLGFNDIQERHNFIIPSEEINLLLRQFPRNGFYALPLELSELEQLLPQPIFFVFHRLIPPIYWIIYTLSHFSLEIKYFVTFCRFVNTFL